jgi:hypothetical protein
MGTDLDRKWKYKRRGPKSKLNCYKSDVEDWVQIMEILTQQQNACNKSAVGMGGGSGRGKSRGG